MLHIHRAERADRLVAALAGVVADPLPDPFDGEVVAVPTRGVERWLTQRLSTSLGASAERGDGVCANVAFPFPGRLVGGSVALASGVDRDTDPWLAERSVWPLLDVVEDCLDERWLAALAAHLGGTGPDADPARRARRFSAVRHLADLYDRYGVHRPSMLRAWADGDDRDGAGGPLPADAAWQAQLWRCLRERIGTPSPAERLDDACARLRADPGLAQLPARVSMFGLTRLPASYLDVLRALAVGHDVHLFLLHPSPALWERVADRPAVPPGPVRRGEDPTAAAPRNPLLASWGRDAREMQLVLTAGEERREAHHRLDEQPCTLLGRVQADVRADRSPPGVPLPAQEEHRAELAADDRSVQVHACHGRARQVEVVRDAIAHLLAEDPTLEPRDVIVMCPDIETFAPLVHATFGAGETDDPDVPDLRVRLADRSLRQTNPVLAVIAEVLDLADARVTASQVLDLAGREPVRRRFRLDDDDLTRVEEWVHASGIRWGLDAAHRAPFQLHTVEANTWKAGLDRVLVGVTMTEDTRSLVGGTLPLDDVSSGEIDLTGRVAELVDRLHEILLALRHPQPVAAWAAALAEAADALTATTPQHAWQRAQLQRLLDEVVSEAGLPRQELVLAEVRALLADRLRGRPTRANFRTGHLTICTLVPMRSVPHRVVCLLGLDDGVFPRRTAPDGDDLVGRDPCVGDPDPRSEDRQLLLDALMAATDHLVVTYTGRDERTNAPRPPAVPVGELLEVLERTVRPHGSRSSVREQVLISHPLQPFDPRNFRVGELVDGCAWSFDRTALAGARAVAGQRLDPPAFLSAPLPDAADDLVEVDALVRFVQHPVKAFLRQRLGVRVSDPDGDPPDALPVALDGLQQWAVGQRLVERRLAGADPRACGEAEVARGFLPPGELGRPVLREIGPVVDLLVEAAAELAGEGAPESVEVHVDVDDRRLVGTVPDVIGDVVRAVTYSRLGPKHRLAAWVRLLAVTAAHPDRPFTAATVGRYSGRGRRWQASVARIDPLAEDPAGRRREALGHLRVLMDLYDRGMREPLPLYTATSAAYAEAYRAGADAPHAAGQAWESGRYEREDREPEHRLVLGGIRPLEDLLAERPRPDEHGEGWPGEEATRFGRYALRLWSGLASCEEVRGR